MLKFIIAWFPMLLLAIANGAVRELVIKKNVGELTAHQLSTVSLLVLFALYVRYIMHNYMPASAPQALLIGFIWLLLTLTFEFGFGRWRGNSWDKLLADYNIFKGHI